MIIGIPLKRSFLDDGRCIFYLKEKIRRMFQNKKCHIKIFIPNEKLNYKSLDVTKMSSLSEKEISDIFNDLLEVDGVFIPSGVKTNYDLKLIELASENNITLEYEENIKSIEEFLENCKNKRSKKTNSKMSVGIPFRYYHPEGLEARIYISEALRNCIYNANGKITMLIPVQDVDYPDTKGNMFEAFTKDEIENMKKQIDRVGGVILPGGVKFTPFDRFILDYCVEKDKPLLGICLGMQILSCYKENIDLVPITTNFNHFQEADEGFTHNVNIERNSLLYRILKKDIILTNSFHFKTVTPNKYLKEIAYTKDGTIEGLEFINKKFILGVQWHPEISYLFDENSKKIIDYFINQVNKEQIN